jgi:hypothetical protein
MARYHVNHRYGSSTFGPWIEGDHVELDEHEAAWVNHDSEGTLTLVDPQEQARVKREAQEESERRRLAEQQAKERREAAERISGVSQADEPGRMDDVPPAQADQADRQDAPKPASRTRRGTGTAAKSGGTSGGSSSGRSSSPRRSGSSGTAKK